MINELLQIYGPDRPIQSNTRFHCNLSNIGDSIFLYAE